MIIIGIILFILGAIFTYFSGIHAQQVSRRLADFRQRQPYVARARWYIIASSFFAVITIVLLIINLSTQKPSSLAASPTPPGSTGTAGPSVIPSIHATSTHATVQSSPTFFVITPSPIHTAIGALTPTPALPIAVQALLQGEMTPVFNVQVGQPRFSTVINNYQLVAPATGFQNPIKQMNAVFIYQPIGTKVEWIALWYQNGELKNIDNKSWSSSPPGLGISNWARPAQDWSAGNYEVQVFIGTGWKASGTFTLSGQPPTITVTSTSIPTTAPTNTPTRTLIPTAMAQPSRTPLPTSTRT